jgi:lipopolysaccharide export system permease protein
VGDYRLFFEGFDWANDTMQKVRIQRWEGNLTTVILAEQGKLVGKGLQLTDFKLYRLNLDALPVPELSTLPEVEGYLQQLIPAQNIGAAGATLTITLSQDRDQIVASNSGSGFGEQQPLSHWWKQLRTPTLAPKERLEARANLHSTLALALGNLVLLVLALPVAVGRASSPGIAFGLALMLSVGYYVLFSLGKVLALSGSLPPELAAWGTNLLALGVGWGLGKGIYR